MKNAKPVIFSPFLEPETSPIFHATLNCVYQPFIRGLVEPGEKEVQSIASESLHPEILSVLCLPTFARPWALWVVGEARYAFSVVMTELESFEQDSDGLPTHSAQLEETAELASGWPRIIARKSVHLLAPDTAALVCDVWKNILLQTRYPKEQLPGCDGATYRFVYRARGTNMAGKTWSPPRHIPPGKLVALSEALRDYTRDSEMQDHSVTQIQALAKDLQQSL